MGKYRVCIAWKETPAGRRCAKYKPLYGIEEVEDFEDYEGLEGRYRRCVAYKMTRGGLRCAKYEPLYGAEISDLADAMDNMAGYYRKCIRYKMTPAGRRCAEYVRLRGVDMLEGEIQITGKSKDKYILVEVNLPSGVITPEDIKKIGTLPRPEPHKGVIISGRAPIWLYGYLIHHYHIASWVAVYDPRLGGAVVVMSHSPEYKEGDVVKL